MAVGQLRLSTPHQGYIHKQKLKLRLKLLVKKHKALGCILQYTTMVMIMNHS